MDEITSAATIDPDAELVKAMARAMCLGKWDARDFNETENGETPDEQRGYYRDLAARALATLREMEVNNG